MSAQITWSVTDMRTVNDVNPNTVHMAVVAVTASQDGVEATHKEPFVLARPTGDFTPYENLTEAQVLQWVFDMITPAGIAQMENGVLANLQDQINPPATPTPNPIPWTAG